MFFKNSQNWKENTRVFNTVYFSPRVNISFQLSVYQVIFFNLKNLFSHCFDTFSLSVNYNFVRTWARLRHGIRIYKWSPSHFFQPHPTPHPLILYFTEFFDPPVILRPSVYSGPKSKGLNLTFKIIFWKYIHHMIDLQIYWFTNIFWKYIYKYIYKYI